MKNQVKSAIKMTQKFDKELCVILAKELKQKQQDRMRAFLNAIQQPGS